MSGVTESRQILERVQSAAVELGIVHGQNFPDPIEAIPIFTSPLVLIVARRFAAEKGWRFSRAADGSLADLRELHQIPYVAFSPDTLLSHYLYEILARHQIEVTVTARVNTSILLVKFVKMGFGVTILDAFTAAAEPDVFDCYPIPAVAAPQTYHLIHRRKSYLSPQGLALLEYLRERRLSTAGLELVAAEDRAPLSPEAVPAGTCPSGLPWRLTGRPGRGGRLIRARGRLRAGWPPAGPTAPGWPGA